MRAEEHSKKDVELLGEGFWCVHKWLDRFFYDTRYGVHHRKLLHNWKGIKEVESIWGQKAKLAVIQHIMDDCELRTEDEIAKDETDYVKRGYY